MTLWFLGRAAGFAALLAFTVTTAGGALAAATSTPSRADHTDRRLLAQATHRHTAVAGLVLLVVHVLAMVTDGYVDVSWTGTAIPFTAGWEPFALGVGTLAVYAIAVTAVSGALRGRLAAHEHLARRWRLVHGAAYLGWGLSVAHGLLAGTDSQQPWALALYGVSVLAVGSAVTWRVLHAGARPVHHLVRSTS